MVLTIGLCFYLAVLYIILVWYRYEENMAVDSLSSFFDAVLWAVVVMLLLSLPYIAFILLWMYFH